MIEDGVPGLHQTYDRPPAARGFAAESDADAGQQTVDAETVRP